jgi:hypothetical protein
MTLEDHAVERLCGDIDYISVGTFITTLGENIGSGSRLIYNTFWLVGIIPLISVFIKLTKFKFKT